jgi:hypothetical protein
MATEIRRSLFIGLGGTGMSTLLSTKKFFVDTYKEVPPMIGFMGVDSDRDFLSTSLESKHGIVSLTGGELCSIIVQNALPVYRRNKDDIYDWIPIENIGSLEGLTGDGCGQVRSNGRFSFCEKYSDISKILVKKINDISSATISNNPNYSLLDGGRIDIHLVFSIGGGTGCGTFIDMAYLIKELVPNAKISAYAILPDVFEAFMNGLRVANIKPNAYGALIDLDYLMHLIPGKSEFKIKYHNREKKFDEAPFRSVVVVDNKNKNGDVYTHINQITEMLGLALATSAGKFSSAEKSSMDNIKGWISDGLMDIENKKAWACGMGISEILFDGDLLSKLYSLKAARRIIQRLSNACISKDVNAVANSWIDSPEVNIREDNGQDNVINFILDKTPKIKFSDSTINSTANPKIDVDIYLDEIARPNKGAVDGKINEILLRSRVELRKTLVYKLNEEFGIGSSINFLDEVERQLNIFLKEMNDELKDWQIKNKQADGRVESSINDLKSADGLGFFLIGKKSKVLDAVDELVNHVNLKSLAMREVCRRESAITVFTGIKNTLIEEKNKIRSFANTLKTIDDQLSNELNKIQIREERLQTFVINLHAEYSKEVEVNNQSLGIVELSKTIPYEGGIYGILTKSTSEIQSMILEYTSTIPDAISFKEISINEILKQLPNDKYNHIIKRAIDKSLPLFQLNFQGYSEPDRHETFVIGVPDNSNSILVTGEDSGENRKLKFRDLIENAEDIEIISTGAKDRIIVYRQQAAAPIFALSGMNNYKEKYTHAKRNCHLDVNLLNKMKSDKFNILPADKSLNDDSIELWVKGILYGFITNEGGTYFLKTKNKELSNPLSGHKVKLNNESNRREQAFAKFKAIKNQIKDELVSEIESFVSNKGAMAIDTIKAQVKKDEEYINKDIAQIKMTKDWISRRGQEDVQNLILEELDYIENKF